MEKTKFQRFINKYNLGGACESVVLSVDKNNLRVRSISDDKNVLCEVSGPTMELNIGEYAVYETQRLRSLLGVVGESLNVTVKKSNDRPVGLEFSDGDTNATFVLADTNAIPSVPELKVLPPMNLTIDMDEKFINTFIKAKGALAEVETFTVISSGKEKEAEIILGYSSLNTNRVKIKVHTKEAVEIKPISFSARYLSEILSANKEAKTGKLEISSKGLARTVFEADEIIAKYYLVQIDTRD